MNVLEYLIRWTGYSADHDQWVPASEMDAPEVERAYWERKGSQPLPKTQPEPSKPPSPPDV